ncbi:MAG TPA: class I SAM-dependent methyltransferase [Sphingobacteriaceae bacterium]|nr:class I SAM-dependent methyltransferase [Sphingobacteriaceae bacterium]
MKEVEIFEGERAATYDKAIRIWCPDYDFIQELIPAILFQQLDRFNDKTILIAGCGTGIEIEALLKAGPSWKITGVDPSVEMTNIAIDKLKKLHSTTKYQIVTGAVADLPLTKNDAATLILVLQFLSDDGAKLNLLQQIADRMHPGAPLVLVDIFGQNDSFSYNLSLLESFLITKGVNIEEVQGGINHIRQNICYIPEERLFELLKLAGFVNTQRFMQSMIFGGWVTEKSK